MIIKLFTFSVKLSVMLNGKTVEELSCVVHARQIFCSRQDLLANHFVMNAHLFCSCSWFIFYFLAVLGIGDILLRSRIHVWILESVPLSDGSRCGSGRPKTYGSGCGSGTLVNSQKEVTKQSRNQGFSNYFCLMMEGSGAGSVLVTNGS